MKNTVEYFKNNNPNNFELEESIRQIFIDETKNKLWADNNTSDCGFSEEYVFWLEQQLISAKENLKEAFEQGGENTVYDDMYGYSSSQTFEEWLETNYNPLVKK
jgi:hypothetical protein